MQNAFWQFHWPLRLLLLVPAVIILSRFQFGTGGYGHLISSSGEWSARLLIAALAITPLRMIFKGQRWPMWLFKRRRDIGVAAFLYAALHLVAYLVHEGSIAVYVADLAKLRILIGWIAFLAMLVPFTLSNEQMLRYLGTWWKFWQRAVYVAAFATVLHWLLIKLDVAPVLIHFAPLAALEAYRLWYNVMKTGRLHPQE